MTARHNNILVTLLTIGLTTGAGVTITQAAVSKNDEAKELQLFSQAKISLSEAIKAAEQKTGGKALEAELDDEAKTVQFEIEIVKDGMIHKVMVDGKTGHVLNAALDDESNEGTENENE